MRDDVILITGGTSGYGFETAKLFAENGCHVVVTGRYGDRLHETAKAIGVDTFRADATDPEDWEKLAAYIQEKYGRIDLLMNNAGGGVAIKETDRLTVEEIDRCIRLNLNSVIYGARAFTPMLKAQGHGTVINVSSVCAKQAWPGWSVYASAKWGVLGFTKGLTTELGPYGIRVTCLIPGAGATNFDKNANFTERGTVPALKGADIAKAVYDVYQLPDHVFVEEITVWGMDQVVIPL